MSENGLEELRNLVFRFFNIINKSTSANLAGLLNSRYSSLSAVILLVAPVTKRLL